MRNQVYQMDSIALRSDIPSSDKLRDWFKVLRPSEQEFVKQKLKGLLHLTRLEVDWFMLQHLVARWNPNTYTFHFGTLELPPLYEEYGHLAGLPHLPGISPLPHFDKPKEYVTSLLQISPANVSTLFTTEGHISIRELCKYQLTPYMPQGGDGQGSARAFILLFAGTVLYPYKKESIHGRAVYLTKAILKGQPFLPNLVGEMNYSLTKIVRKAREGVRNHHFSFSPPLLQAWFYTHIGITGESFRREQFPDLLDRISNRARLPTCTFAGDRALFRSLEPEDFYQKAKCFDVDLAINDFVHID